EHSTSGYNEFKAHVESFTLEYAEGITGVPAEAIRDLAHDYATAPTAQLCWTLGITEHANATDNVLALINLSLLTGHLGRYGSGLVPLRGQNNVQGGGDMGSLPNKLPGFQNVTDPALRGKFETAWGTEIPAEIGWHVTEMFDAMERTDITAMYILGENPAQSEADSVRTIGLLEGLEHLVVQDLFLTKTAQLADVVFPAAVGWAETEERQGRLGDDRTDDRDRQSNKNRANGVRNEVRHDDPTFGCTDGPGRFDELTLLHRQHLPAHEPGQTHPGGETEDGDEHCRTGSKQGRHQDQQQQKGEGEDGVHHPHQHGVDHVATGGGGEADTKADEQGDQGAEGGDRERDPAAAEESRQDIAAEAVAAQPQSHIARRDDVAGRDRGGQPPAVDQILSVVELHLG
ncbi:MAG: molybdopterin-dependent oxidoreductase, partial [Acidobacteria bacterium]|nr:molybdopterin-dependent oxidoreductase [Candidatus Sulfomarinibacter sp. MAG AM2]